jgi:hypothetical protein
MSEAIKIKEGGVDRSQNQINKLKTNTVGGGVCFWVPETERQTDDKRITANGTYTAEEEGLYGYDEIDVSVPNTGSMSGKGADGNDYSITVDDNGYIVETKIPSYIKITTPPLKLVYYDGESIDVTGMVVSAYDAEGNYMQDVDLSEIIIEPTTAEYGGGSGYEGDGVIDGVTYKIDYTNHYEITVYADDEENKYRWAEWDGLKNAVIYHGGESYAYIFASDNPEDTVMECAYQPDGTPTSGYPKYESPALSYSYDGKKVYYTYGTSTYSGSGPWEISCDVNNLVPRSEYKSNANKYAWVMVYGNARGGSTEEISVKWARPVDSKQLETSFEISTLPVESGSAHGGGNDSGGFEGGGSEHGF